MVLGQAPLLNYNTYKPIKRDVYFKYLFTLMFQVLPEYTESIQPSREKELRHVTTQVRYNNNFIHRSVCPKTY